MPELPEVETIRLGLQKYLVGHKILNVEVKVSKLFEGDPKDIAGSKVQKVRRFGKGLVIDLSNGYSLAIHIKLTGQLIYQGPKVSPLRQGYEGQAKVSWEKLGGELPNKFTHVIFELDPPRLASGEAGQGAHLYYNDVRRFGWIKVVETSKVEDIPFFKNMGPEPSVSKASSPRSNSGQAGQAKLTLDYFSKVIRSSNVAVKPLIMDQKRIGGIGNIYANDALFLARIDPRRKAKSLSSQEIKKLYDAVYKVMEKGMKYGGSSELNYVNALGQKGEYQNHTLAYGKEGQKCPNCGGVIKKIYLGGRGTYFCPKCQK